MSDDSFMYRFPGIDIKITGAAVQTITGKINKCHNSNYNIENNMPFILRSNNLLASIYL
jgi:hypothetical protein